MVLQLFFERKYSLFPELGEEEGEFYLEFKVGETFKDLLELSFHYGFIVELEDAMSFQKFQYPRVNTYPILKTWAL